MSDAAVRLIVVFMSSLGELGPGTALEYLYSHGSHLPQQNATLCRLEYVEFVSYCRAWDLLNLFLRQFVFTFFDLKVLT